jgi:hypothetical protein
MESPGPVPEGLTHGDLVAVARRRDLLGGAADPVMLLAWLAERAEMGGAPRPVGFRPRIVGDDGGGGPRTSRQQDTSRLVGSLSVSWTRSLCGRAPHSRWTLCSRPKTTFPVVVTKSMFQEAPLPFLGIAPPVSGGNEAARPMSRMPSNGDLDASAPPSSLPSPSWPLSGTATPLLTGSTWPSSSAVIAATGAHRCADPSRVGAAAS